MYNKKNSTPKKQYQQVLIAARTRNPQLFYTTVNRISLNLFFGCSKFNYLRPGGFLAMNGEIDAARWLLTHGACISHVAEGAALGGQIAFANELLEKGANINIIAQGATCSGHLEFARTLQENGANINFIAQGAASGRYIAFANELLEQGADINFIARGARSCNHIVTIKQQLYFLKHFSIPNIKRFSELHEFSRIEIYVFIAAIEHRERLNSSAQSPSRFFATSSSDTATCQQTTYTRQSLA